MVIEFGFILSASREIAQKRDNLKTVERIVAGVNGAKVIFVLVIIILSLVLFTYVPILQQNSKYFFFSLFWAIGIGINPIWYFQGIEKLSLQALFEILAKIIATGLVFVLVLKDGDGWIFLALLAFSSLFTSMLNTFLMYNKVRFILPAFTLILNSIKNAWPLFIYRGAVSLYTTANVIIVGVFLSETDVGFYGGAEKISKGFLIFIGPLSQAIYPRINNLIKRDFVKAAKLALLSLKTMVLITSIISAVVFIFAPQIVTIFLGEDYYPVIYLLRVLIWILPFMAVGNVLGLQWMLPNGLDRYFNIIIIFAGIINISLAVILLQLFALEGMVWAVLSTELFVSLALLIVVVRKTNLFSYHKYEIRN